MISKLGGRKTVMSVAAMIAGIAIDLHTERGLSENLMYLLMFIIGAYSTANVVNKQVTKQEPVDIDTDALNDLKEGQGYLEQNVSGIINVIENLQQQVDTSNKRVAALLKKAE